MSAYRLEVAANSVASACAAQAGGADRVELCAALELGGITPSWATIAMARDRLRIPLYVLVRPRAGDFLYDDLECESMLRDVETCARLGCDGVVLGLLDADGQVDVPRCRPLVAAAGGMGVTFHRAFDLASQPEQALEAIVDLGCERILTSGGAPTALQATALIRALVVQAGDRLSVMPGAGVHAGNLAELALATGASDFHASAKRQHPSGMRIHARLGDMAGGEIRSDERDVRAMATVLRQLV
ncbi:copper homeostasis protein CutC [Dyella sp. A6]|uniref:copper homeostasis protein CutC n=1 Tax=Dyella aluminiiresistens TaxID=3069105 RepID=UPI002E75A8AB|nr:copper homeostasis protein CutC [Dyella sp. A6]